MVAGRKDAARQRLINDAQLVVADAGARFKDASKTLAPVRMSGDAKKALASLEAQTGQLLSKLRQE